MARGARGVGGVFGQVLYFISPSVGISALFIFYISLGIYQRFISAIIFFRTSFIKNVMSGLWCVRVIQNGGGQAGRQTDGRTDGLKFWVKSKNTYRRINFGYGGLRGSLSGDGKAGCWTKAATRMLIFSCRRRTQKPKNEPRRTLSTIPREDSLSYFLTRQLFAKNLPSPPPRGVL